MKDFTQGREWRQILDFALPMLLGNLFMQLYQFVDTAIVGRFVGKEALAAVGASTPVIFTTIALVVGMGVGASIVISQYFGMKQYLKVQATSDTLMIFLAGAAVVITLLGVFFSGEILRLMKLPEEIVPLAADYLEIYFGGSLFLFGFNSVSAVLRGVGDAKTPLYFLVISSVLNVGLDFLFIVGLDWGVPGAAWATVIAQGVAFVLAVLYVNKKHTLLKFNVINPKFDGGLFRQCLRMGLPSGFQQTFVAVGMMALMGVVNGFGTDVIAAYSAVNRIDTFVALPVMTFAAALTSFTGQNAGAGKWMRIRRGLRDTLWMSSGCVVVINVALILFGRAVLRIFTDDPAVLDVGYECLVVMNSTYVLFNLMFIINGMLRGAGATVFTMCVTFVSLWLFRVPAAVFLSRIFGETGIWWAIPLGWGAGLAGSAIYFCSGRWKNKGVNRLQRSAEMPPAEEGL